MSTQNTKNNDSKATLCPVYAAAIQFSEQPAVTGPTMLDYAQLDQRIRNAARILQGLGVRRGDRIALLGAATPAYCIALWALFRLGAVACPLNTRWPERRIREVLKLLGPSMALSDEPAFFRGYDVASFAVLVEDGCESPTERGPAFIDAEAPATIVMTAGSSGMPKAVVHCIRNHLQSAAAANANLPLTAGDRWLLSLPLYHVSGLAVLFRCALAGATVVQAPERVGLEVALEQYAITHISLVPTQLRRLMSTPGGVEALGRLKGVLVGGAPIAETLAVAAVRHGVPLIRSYGMTETAAQLCATQPGADITALQSDGRPLCPGAMRVGDDGVIEVRGNTLFLGYYEPGGVLRRPETPDGWFRTGDTGFIDSRGLLYITGRADAMFISGGENIHPEEIEDALCALPGVVRALVVPVTHDDYGAVPFAFLECENDIPLDARAFKSSLEIVLPGYKIPRCYAHWPEEMKDTVKPDRAWCMKQAARIVGRGDAILTLCRASTPKP